MIAEVQRAPTRRLDNVVSRLYRYTRRLKMHGQVIGQKSIEENRRFRSYGLIGFAVVAVAALGIYGTISFSDRVAGPVAGIVGVAVLALVAVIGVFVMKKRAVPPPELFEHAFAQELALKDKVGDLRQLWASVEGQVRLAFRAGNSFSSLGRSDLRKLDRILNVEVPKMRAEAESSRKAPEIE